MSRLLCASILLLPGSALAVDGISVTIHWSGVDAMFYGGFGEIWRHEIKNSEVIDSTKIDDGPARMVVISPTGKSVAFIKQDGTVATMSIKGGTITDLAQGHPEGALDWPDEEWVYFSMGGWDQFETSRYLYRVNVQTGVEELVTQFDCSTWRFHISNDLTRLVARAVSGCGSAGTIVAYDLAANDGILSASRATDSPSCGEAFDPEGIYFVDGMIDHSGIDIRRWDTLEIVDTIIHAQATAWGGPDSGANHNRNHWSVNSGKWICFHLGWEVHHGAACRGANQVLYNWVDQERIVVTGNVEGSYTYDSAGDFWVGAVDGRPNVNAGADQVVALATGAELRGVATDDGDTLTVAWSQVSGAGTATFTAPSAAITHVDFDTLGEYTLRLSADDGEQSAHDDVVITVADNGAPIVDAGVDQTVLVSTPTLIEATASDDGLPNGTLNLSWAQLTGPVDALFDWPQSARTWVALPEAGAYELQLSADDGEHQISDTVVINAVENAAPVVLAGEDFKILPGTSAFLSGSVTDDGMPNDSITSSWTAIDGPGEVTFTDAGSPQTEADFSSDGSYQLRLVAHDGTLASFDDITVTIGPNEAPVVSAGEDQRAPLGRSVLLLGEATDDGLPNGELGYLWSQLDGPSDVSFASPDEARTLVYLENLGSYTLQLEVSDGELQSTDEVIIEVGEVATLTLVSPNGGEVWQVGSTQQIAWQADDLEDVTISLSIDDGESWDVIVPSVDTSSPNWQSYPYVVPDRPSPNCRIAIDAYIGSGDRAISTNTFSIVAAPVPPPAKEEGCECTGSSGALPLVGLALFVRRRLLRRRLQ